MIFFVRRNLKKKDFSLKFYNLLNILMFLDFSIRFLYFSIRYGSVIYTIFGYSYS